MERTKVTLKEHHLIIDLKGGDSLDVDLSSLAEFNHVPTIHLEQGDVDLSLKMIIDGEEFNSIIPTNLNNEINSIKTKILENENDLIDNFNLNGVVLVATLKDGTIKEIDLTPIIEEALKISNQELTSIYNEFREYSDESFVKKLMDNEGSFVYGRTLGVEGVFQVSDSPKAYALAQYDKNKILNTGVVSAVSYIIPTNNEDNLLRSIHYDVASNCIELGTCTDNGGGELIYNESHPIATRDDSLNYTNGNLIKWDSLTGRFIDAGISSETIRKGEGIASIELNAGSNLASDHYALATGFSTKAAKQCTFTTGAFTEANADNAIAGGVSSIANAYDSVALNQGTITTINGQTSIGRFNAEDNNALFIVGNGEGIINQDNSATATLRKNAFTVNINGTATLESDPINDGDIVTKRYSDKNRIYKHKLALKVDSLECNLILFNKSSNLITPTNLKIALENALNIRCLSYQENEVPYNIFSFNYSNSYLCLLVTDVNNPSIISTLFILPEDINNITDVMEEY